MTLRNLISHSHWHQYCSYASTSTFFIFFFFKHIYLFILSSIDGKLWEDMRKDFNSLLKVLPGPEKLKQIAKKHLDIMLAQSIESDDIIDANYIAEITMKVFIEFLFEREWELKFNILVKARYVYRISDYFLFHLWYFFRLFWCVLCTWIIIRFWILCNFHIGIDYLLFLVKALYCVLFKQFIYRGLILDQQFIHSFIHLRFFPFTSCPPESFFLNTHVCYYHLFLFSWEWRKEIAAKGEGNAEVRKKKKRMSTEIWTDHNVHTFILTVSHFNLFP